MANNRLIHEDEDALPVVPETAVQSMAKTLADPPVDNAKRKVYPGRRQVTAHIPRQLFLWLKAISAQTDKPMILIMEEALNEYVQRHAAQKKFGG
jgi:hypothetical protein